MSCARCHLFHGSPCNCCRTLARLKALLEGGHLLLAQESSVLAALRSAAGAIADLSEEAAPILAAEKTLSAFPPKAEKKSPSPVQDSTKESSSVLGSTKRKAFKEEEDEEEGSPKEKEAAKTKKRERRTSGGVRIAPARLRKDKKKKDKKERSKSKEAKDEEEEIEEEVEEDKKSEASEDQEDRRRGLGLSTIPRGSAGRHFGDRHGGVPGRERPPEPVGPPPGRFHTDSYWGSRDRERTSTTPRGTKGSKHRERGAEHKWKSWPDRR